MVKIYLKEILKEKGKTSKEFAEEMGVTAAAISNIVTGRNYPTYDLLEKMAEKLEVKMSTLLGWSKTTLVLEWINIETRWPTNVKWGS